MLTVSAEITPLPVETERLVGAWYILASNASFWRDRNHARLDLLPHASGRDGQPRLRHELRFRKSALFGPTRRVLLGTAELETPGRFHSRSEGALRLPRWRWSVAVVDERDDRWLVTWSSPSTLNPIGGLTIQSRDPVLSKSVLADIKARVAAHPELVLTDSDGMRRCDRLVAIEQDWVPPKPYDLHIP